MKASHAVNAAFSPSPQDPHPLAGVEYTGEIEEDSHREIDALMDTFSGRAKREAERFELATDSEFWFAVCFQSREQKEAFLQAMGWTGDDKYLNGIDLAHKEGVLLPRVELPKPKGISSRMERMARNSIKGGEV